jgi:acyl-CoA thioesterase-1
MPRRALVHLLFALCIALAASVCAAAAPVVLVLGDSISAGYGLPAETGWTTLLQQRLAAEHYPHRVVNASISGDTTAGGRTRLDALLARHHPGVTVIELGGNDGLRGGSLDAMRANLDAMVAAAQKSGSRVLLVGLRLPPNYGPAYVRRFETTYADVARDRKAALVPFLFEGFAEDNAMFQPDRIHPVIAAQEKLLDNVWPALKPLLGQPDKPR